LIAAQQDPASPQYHRWLTPETFAARFGMNDSDLAKVQNWLQQQGFAIDSVARSKNAIHFTGTVRQVEQAFSTEMHIYKINGTQHFAPSTALSVPRALAPTVLAINHLDDFRPRAHVIFPKSGSVRPAFTSSQTGDVFFAPGDIATVYDIKPLASASITGTGQTIALVGQSQIQNSDIEAFEAAAGLATKDPVQFLVPSTGNAAVNPNGSGDEAESDLDVEWSGAIAPGATIDFVFTGNSSNNNGAFDAITYAIDQDLAPIVSSSYGTCEADLGTFSLESVFEQAATQGQTVISAAGDEGSTDCYGISGLTTAQQEALAVDYPASSPNVTAMGGTEISSTADSGKYLIAGDGYWSAQGSSDIVSSALQYIPEVAWNDDESNCGASDCLSSGGGGASSLFAKPTWQTGVPGIPSDGKRDVPDLALYASPNYPGYLYCSSDPETGITGSCATGFRDSTSQGNLTIAGGTSFDAPIFSGILALINEKAGYTEGQGLINPTLYTLAANSATYASAFHDITTGTNDCTAGSAFCSGTIGFSAGTGYDQVTGLGSVDAANLADVWPVNSSATSTLIDTTTSITASSNSLNVNVADTFTISVTSATGSTVPTGSLSLVVDGGTPVAETLTANGTFIYTASFASAGSHIILAKYAGDATHTPSSSSLTVTVTAVSSGKGTFTLSSSPASLTVSQGTSGSEIITVTPASGYTGTVDVTFDTSNDTNLQNLCYNFSSQNTAGNGTVAISGTTAGTVSLVLDTNASDCFSTTGAIRNGKKSNLKRLGATTTSKNNQSDKRLPLSIAFAGLLLAGFIGRSSRRLRGLAAILLLAATGLAVTACGSSVNTTVSDPPKGTYTVTVTGTDSTTSTITGTTKFTFVID